MFCYHYYDIISYIIIIMKLLSIGYTYAVISTLFIKYVNKMNFASDNTFSNYKTENIYVTCSPFHNKPKQLEIITMIQYVVV